MKDTAIIGDVHGCLGPLEALVDKLDLDASGHLIFVGDVLDKGPDSPGVLRYIRKLHEEAPFQVTLIEGNHEDKHLRYHRNKTARPVTAAGMAAASKELRDIDRGLKRKDRDYLKTAIPLLRLPDWNILIVHGGIPGDMEAFPTLEEAKTLKGKAKQRFLKIQRTRYLSHSTGAFLAYGTDQPGDPFWAETYDGRFGHVIFGHQPFPGVPACYPHATGIDTGAVHGYTLTALALPATGEPHFVSVPGLEFRPFKTGRGPEHPGGELTLKRPENAP